MLFLPSAANVLAVLLDRFSEARYSCYALRPTFNHAYPNDFATLLIVFDPIKVSPVRTTLLLQQRFVRPVRRRHAVLKSLAQHGRVELGESLNNINLRRSKIHRMIASGEIPSVIVSRGTRRRVFRVRPSDLQKWLKAREQSNSKL